MKKVRITVMRKACYEDLMAKYENPMEDACAMEGRAGIHREWLAAAGRALRECLGDDVAVRHGTRARCGRFL